MKTKLTKDQAHALKRQREECKLAKMFMTNEIQHFAWRAVKCGGVENSIRRAIQAATIKALASFPVSIQ